MSRFARTTSDAMVSPVVTHLHLLRHGRVDTGGRRLAYGWADLPLSAVGRAESSRLVEFALRNLPQPDGVLSSDLARCVALAEPLAKRLGVPLRVSPDLREQHMGDWEEVAWDDLQVRRGTAVNDYWDDYVGARPPGGESYADAAGRVADWWESHQRELEGGRWFVAGHVGVIRALACHLLGVPFSDALRFAPAHGSHSHMLVAEAGSVLQVLGEVPPDDDAARAAQAEQYAAGPRERARVKRIALSGSAGTGKTTLGRRLAEHLELPFIEEGMRARLEAGLDIHCMDASEHRALLLELWDEQRTAEGAAIDSAGGFVADRGAIDFAAFALLFHSHEEAWCEEHVPAWLAAGDRYDRVLVLPWGVLPMEADGMRSTNRWFQRRFQATVEGLLDRDMEPTRIWRIPGLDALEARVRWVLERIHQGRP